MIIYVPIYLFTCDSVYMYEELLGSRWSLVGIINIVATKYCGPVFVKVLVHLQSRISRPKLRKK